MSSFITFVSIAGGIVEFAFCGLVIMKSVMSQTCCGVISVVCV